MISINSFFLKLLDDFVLLHSCLKEKLGSKRWESWGLSKKPHQWFLLKKTCPFSRIHSPFVSYFFHKLISHHFETRCSVHGAVKHQQFGGRTSAIRAAISGGHIGSRGRRHLAITIMEIAIISELVFHSWRGLRWGIITTGLYPVGVEAGRGCDVGCGRGGSWRG